MKMCAICGEHYGEGYANCPNCGCPDQKYTIAGLGFPQRLEQQYELAGLRRGSGGRLFLVLTDRRTGGRILAGKIPPEEKWMQQLVLRQKEERLPQLPAVYETGWLSDHLIYLFEEVPGVTLEELSQREYPLDAETVRHAKNFTGEQLRLLAARGYVLGKTDLSTCGITSLGIRLRDFGGEELPPGKGDNYSGWLPGVSGKKNGVSLKEILRRNMPQLIIALVLALIVAVQLILLFGYWR